MNRPLSELKIRASAILQLPDALRQEFIGIAASKSPSSAFKLACQLAMLHGFNQIQALGLAKACRWLSVIRRDYGQQAFDETMRGGT